MISTVSADQEFTKLHVKTQNSTPFWCKIGVEITTVNQSPTQLFIVVSATKFDRLYLLLLCRANSEKTLYLILATVYVAISLCKMHKILNIWG